jgi:hypothetical protein
MKAATLDFRRTLIPPCLVVGVGLLLCTALFYLQSPHAALRHASPLLPIGMAMIGGLVLAAGVFNMLLVRAQQASAAPAPGRAAPGSPPDAPR